MKEWIYLITLIKTKYAAPSRLQEISWCCWWATKMGIGKAPCTEGAPIVQQDVSGRAAHDSWTTPVWKKKNVDFKNIPNCLTSFVPCPYVPLACQHRGRMPRASYPGPPWKPCWVQHPAWQEGAWAVVGRRALIVEGAGLRELTSSLTWGLRILGLVRNPDLVHILGLVRNLGLDRTLYPDRNPGFHSSVVTHSPGHRSCCMTSNPVGHRSGSETLGKIHPCLLIVGSGELHTETE